MSTARDHDPAPINGLAVDRRFRQGHRLACSKQIGARDDGSAGDAGGNIRAQRLCQAHRSVDVQRPRALLDQVISGERLCRVLENGLDQRGGQPRIRLQHQCNRAADDGGGYRGSGKLHQTVRHVGRIPGHAQERVHRDQLVIDGGPVVVRHRAEEAVAGRDQVGLDQVVRMRVPAVVEPYASRGSTGAEVIDDVVDARCRAPAVVGADGDDRRVVGGRRDGSVDFGAGGRFAKIARRDDDRKTGSGCAAHRAAQRVGPIRFGRIRGQAEIQNADSVFLAVIDHPVDAGEHVADFADAVVAQYLDVIERCIRRDATRVRNAGDRPSDGDRCDVRAMAVLVAIDDRSRDDGAFAIALRFAGRKVVDRLVLAELALGEAVVAAHRIAGERQVDRPGDSIAAACGAQSQMLAVDPGVEDRDADTGAVQRRGRKTAGKRRVRRAGDGSEEARRARRRSIRRDAVDVGPRGDQIDCGAGNDRRKALNGLIAVGHSATGRGNGSAQIGDDGIRPLADDDHLVIAVVPCCLDPTRIGRDGCGHRRGQIGCDLQRRRRRLGVSATGDGAGECRDDE